MTLVSGAKMVWSVKHENTTVIAPSIISLTLGNGDVLVTNTDKLTVNMANGGGFEIIISSQN